MGILDYLLDQIRLPAMEAVPDFRSITMNRLGRDILESTGARIRSTWGGNQYMPRPNIIYLNRLGETAPARWAKFMLDRDQSVEMSFYHELGHAFVHVFGIDSDEEANSLFGDFSTASPGGLGVLRASSRRKKEGYLTRYAMEHPEEDFADCFAYVVFNGMNIGDRVEDRRVHEKLLYIQTLINRHIV